MPETFITCEPGGECAESKKPSNLLSNSYAVEEINIDHPDLIVLSIGFCSTVDPLDVLHIVCPRRQGGTAPPATEDLLYLERTDQGLACDGRDVVSLSAGGGEIELQLTSGGARQLQLDAVTRFTFGDQRDLWTQALAQIRAMADAGQGNVRTVDD